MFVHYVRRLKSLLFFILGSRVPLRLLAYKKIELGDICRFADLRQFQEIIMVVCSFLGGTVVNYCFGCGLGCLARSNDWWLFTTRGDGLDCALNKNAHDVSLKGAS